MEPISFMFDKKRVAYVVVKDCVGTGDEKSDWVVARMMIHGLRLGIDGDLLSVTFVQPNGGKMTEEEEIEVIRALVRPVVLPGEASESRAIAEKIEASLGSESQVNRAAAAQEMLGSEDE